MMWKDLPTPCYVVDEGKIRKNLEILANLEQECGCHILLAQKAFSMYSLYPMIGQYISGTTASGLYEARLGYEEMGKENHVFAPAYKEKDMEELVQICDHIIFNSFAQYEKYKEMCRESAKVRKDKKAVSVGIRINPQCSTQEGHEIYDPCGYASRLGVTEEQFREDLLEGVEGLHFHTLCEQNADDLVTTFQAFEKKFGKYLYRMKWLNMGGGHHITRENYQMETLKKLIRYIRETYPVEVYLEPGEAIALTACPCAMQETVLRVDICASHSRVTQRPATSSPSTPTGTSARYGKPYHLPSRMVILGAQSWKRNSVQPLPAPHFLP